MSVINTSMCTDYPLAGQVESRRVEGNVLAGGNLNIREESIYLSCEGDLYIAVSYCYDNLGLCNPIQCFRTSDMKIAENVSRFRLQEAEYHYFGNSEYEIYYQNIGDDPRLDGWHQFPLSEEYIKGLMEAFVESLPVNYFL